MGVSMTNFTPKLGLFVALTTSVLSVGCNSYRYEARQDVDQYGRNVYTESGWRHEGKPYEYSGRQQNCYAQEDSYVTNCDEAFAQQYGVQRQSAQKILTLASGKHPFRSMRQVGLKMSDARYLQNRQMPSQETIDRVGKTLGEDSDKIQNIVQDFVMSAR